MEVYKPIDSYTSYRVAEAFMESEYKKGRVTHEKKNKVLRDARDNYKSQSYNKQIERLNKENGVC